MLPLPLGSYRPWAIMAMGIVISLVFLLHLANAVFNSERLYPPLYSWPIFAVLGVVICVCIWQISNSSIDPYQTKQALIKTSFMLMFCWLTFVYCNSAQRVKKLIYVVITAAVTQSIYATYLNFSPDVISPIFGYKHTDRAIGTFTYSNFLANYLALCLSLGIGLLVSELNRANIEQKKSIKQKLRNFFEMLLSPKVIIRLSLIIVIMALILTRSRMGNSAFFIALFVMSFIALFIYKNQPKSFKILVISFFILDLIIIGAVFGVDKVKQRLVETSIASETRDEVVIDSIPLILDKPLLGSGGGTFYTAFPQHQSGPYSSYYDNAHNDYIQFSVEYGMPTTLLLGLMVIYCLWLCLLTMRKRKTALYQGVAFGCAIAIVDMLLHSTVDYSLQAGANSMYFMLILCVAILTNKLPPPVRSYK